MRQNPKRRLRNRNFIGNARAYVRKARTSLEGTTEISAARTAIFEAVSALDKAAAKGVVHKNNAARRKGRLMKQLAALEKQSS
jgi:small subunit ribosomal protein S20